ncbi:thiamine biosynthesis protein ThiS [Terriglobus roseus DSM 18391]|uniref:Thiamine biosynthesis protein ThiS n=1 Tax=Terriglobus roseus (strain DSM 18391 / NRRL B-41598 / KBS 63) TaxID=926566 RepID=I3ZG57_TERRK|nr:sulfur carrier protein ThiS [Terriglobus roseus]AFL88225.1 thiamine biosynthesis protein ThiS [Terriglobus roseus DSM 18391]
MAGPITVTLNGAERTFDDLGETPYVTALVAALGFRGDRVALERNGDIVPRSTWPDTPVQSGDRFEVVHFVGGGKR